MLAAMLIYSVPLTLVVLTTAGVYGLLRWWLFRPMREAVNEQLVFAAADMLGEPIPPLEPESEW
jgi:ABC-type bacteriocin/lantibiotic exporter with double-glycine peptidase domain